MTKSIVGRSGTALAKLEPNLLLKHMHPQHAGQAILLISMPNLVIVLQGYFTLQSVERDQTASRHDLCRKNGQILVVGVAQREADDRPPMLLDFRKRTTYVVVPLVQLPDGQCFIPRRPR
jgi:hypothetical protein